MSTTTTTPVAAKAEDDTTAEIITTLESIIVGMKRDNDAIRSDVSKLREKILQPADISSIVDTHIAAQVNDIKDIKMSLAQLRAKSQQRLSMDPTFVDEVKQLSTTIFEQQRAQLAAQFNPGPFTSEQREEMKREFMRYQSTVMPRIVNGDESRSMPRVVKNLSISANVPRFIVDNNIGVSSQFGKRNKFVEEQKIHVQRHLSERQAAVLAQYSVLPSRRAELLRNRKIAHVINKIDVAQAGLQAEIKALARLPSTEETKLAVAKKQQALIVNENSKLTSLMALAPDDETRVELERQTASIHPRLSACAQLIQSADQAVQTRLLKEQRARMSPQQSQQSQQQPQQLQQPQQQQPPQLQKSRPQQSSVPAIKKEDRIATKTARLAMPMVGATRAHQALIRIGKQ